MPSENRAGKVWKWVGLDSGLTLGKKKLLGTRRFPKKGSGTGAVEEPFKELVETCLVGQKKR